MWIDRWRRRESFGLKTSTPSDVVANICQKDFGQKNSPPVAHEFDRLRIEASELRAGKGRSRCLVSYPDPAEGIKELGFGIKMCVDRLPGVERAPSGAELAEGEVGGYRFRPSYLEAQQLCWKDGRTRG